jgi:hypothetical protein
MSVHIELSLGAQEARRRRGICYISTEKSAQTVLSELPTVLMIDIT